MRRGTWGTGRVLYAPRRTRASQSPTSGQGGAASVATPSARQGSLPTDALRAQSSASSSEMRGDGAGRSDDGRHHQPRAAAVSVARKQTPQVSRGASASWSAPHRRGGTGQGPHAGGNVRMGSRHSHRGSDDGASAPIGPPGGNLVPDGRKGTSYDSDSGSSRSGSEGYHQNRRGAGPTQAEYFRQWEAKMASDGRRAGKVEQLHDLLHKYFKTSGWTGPGQLDAPSPDQIRKAADLFMCSTTFVTETWNALMESPLCDSHLRRGQGRPSGREEGPRLGEQSLRRELHPTASMALAELPSALARTSSMIVRVLDDPLRAGVPAHKRAGMYGDWFRVLCLVFLELASEKKRLRTVLGEDDYLLRRLVGKIKSEVPGSGVTVLTIADLLVGTNYRESLESMSKTKTGSGASGGFADDLLEVFAPVIAESRGPNFTALTRTGLDTKAKVIGCILQDVLPTLAARAAKQALREIRSAVNDTSFSLSQADLGFQSFVKYVREHLSSWVNDECEHSEFIPTAAPPSNRDLAQLGSHFERREVELRSQAQQRRQHEEFEKKMSALQRKVDDMQKERKSAKPTGKQPSPKPKQGRQQVKKQDLEAALAAAKGRNPLSEREAAMQVEANKRFLGVPGVLPHVCPLFRDREAGNLEQSVQRKLCSYACGNAKVIREAERVTTADDGSEKREHVRFFQCPHGFHEPAGPRR
jgi:hypothetical protein